MPISLFIALRYLFKNKKEKSISSMIKICFFSIFICTFSLALIVSIMQGFQAITYEKIKNINPDIILQSNNDHLNFEKISKVLKNEFPEIEAFSESDMHYVIIDSNDNLDINNLILLKGINPENEIKINDLLKKIKIKNNKLLKNNEIIIGKKLAKDFNLKIGNEIILLIPDSFSANKIELTKKKVIIKDLFSTGVDEFDNKLALCSLFFLKEIFPDSGISQINIKLKNENTSDQVIKKLKKRFKLNAYSWKELYPGLFSSLNLEKYIMIFIFILVLAIASMNISSLSFMFINHKIKDIAILKSMGLNNLQIKSIFLIIGITITFLANLSGLILAFIIGNYLNYKQLIKLPDIYYLDYLPVKVTLFNFSGLFVLIMCIGFCATLLALKKLNLFKIAELIKVKN